jgi:trigger factor
MEVPNSMMLEQKNILIEDVRGKMQRDGMSDAQFEEYKTKWDKEFDESARFIIASSLLVNTIAKNENLLASEEEFESRMEKYAAQTGMEIEKIKAFYNKSENRSRVMFQITEEKVVALIMSEAKIKEVPKAKLKKEEETHR